MNLFFLIPLAISLMAAFFRFHTQEEMTAILSTITAIAGLLISFALASWIVQVLILLGSLGPCGTTATGILAKAVHKSIKGLIY